VRFLCDYLINTIKNIEIPRRFYSSPHVILFTEHNMAVEHGLDDIAAQLKQQNKHHETASLPLLKQRILQTQKHGVPSDKVRFNRINLFSLTPNSQKREPSGNSDEP
jgi:hypothetical protein